jgi:2-dehydro-3-deoxygluconokinase
MPIQILCFGEIMLRLSPSGFQKLEQAKEFKMDFGGSESNVAASLAQLGCYVKYLSRVPEQPISQAALQSLAQFGVNTSVTVKGGDRLGIYFVEQGSGRRNSKVIYDRKNSGMHTLQPGQIDWNHVLEDVSWFHWSGITPSLSLSAAKATLEGLQIAFEKKIFISCDLNYRSKLWDYGVPPHKIMPELVELAGLVVGDIDVLPVYFELEAKSTQEGFEVIQNRFPNVQYIAMTDREGRSASHNDYQGYLFHRSNTFLSRYYDLPDMVDRIGSGDAFMAGLIYGLQSLPHDQSSLQNAVDLATACAVYKHYVPSDLNVFTLEDLVGLMKGGTGGKVKR